MTWKPPAGTDILSNLREASANLDRLHAEWIRSWHTSGIPIVVDDSVTQPTLHVSREDYATLLSQQRIGPTFRCPDCHCEMTDEHGGKTRYCWRCAIQWTSERGFFG